jgi:ribulose 1,5-bisphosphate carboxylase large subunit-like protein
VDAQEFIDEDFCPLEQMEDSLVKARKSQIEDKAHASDAVEAVAIAQTAGAVTAVAAAEEHASNNVMANMYAAASADNGSDVGSDGVNITGLNFQEVQ